MENAFSHQHLLSQGFSAQFAVKPFFSSDNDIIGAGPQNEKCTFSFATIKRKFSEIVSSPLRAFSHLTAGRCISVSGCINVHNVNCNLSTMDVIIIIIIIILIITIFSPAPSVGP